MRLRSIGGRAQMGRFTSRSEWPLSVGRVNGRFVRIAVDPCAHVERPRTIQRGLTAPANSACARWWGGDAKWPKNRLIKRSATEWVSRLLGVYDGCCELYDSVEALVGFVGTHSDALELFELAEEVSIR